MAKSGTTGQKVTTSAVHLKRTQDAENVLCFNDPDMHSKFDIAVVKIIGAL